MLYYLDTNIVIYVVEGAPALKQRARNHFTFLESVGHRFVVGELTWTECLVDPLVTANGPQLFSYYEFLQGPLVSTVAVTTAIHRRAAMIRGVYKLGLADALHLATAVECRADRFLTNDQTLAAFPDVTVEILP